MQAVRFEALQQLRPWLLSRVWPGRYPALEASFENFRSVLDDLVEAFDAGVRPTGVRFCGRTVGTRISASGIRGCITVA